MARSEERGAVTRKTIIDIARRRQRPGSGSVLAGISGTRHMRWPELAPVLGDIPWAIVGAVATRSYMPERATADLDIAILPEDAPLIHQRLLDARFTKQLERAIAGTSWRSPDRTPVDVLEGGEPWWSDALREAAENRDDGAPVLPLRYLVLMKLAASRAQDVADVSRMLGLAAADALAGVRDAVTRFAPDLRDDVESLISLGQLEHQG